MKSVHSNSQSCSLQVISTFLLMGLIFIPVGIVTLRASYSVYIISSYIHAMQFLYLFPFQSTSICLL